jgi:hypothetical protein
MMFVASTNGSAWARHDQAPTRPTKHVLMYMKRIRPRGLRRSRHEAGEFILMTMVARYPDRTMIQRPPCSPIVDVDKPARDEIIGRKDSGLIGERIALSESRSEPRFARRIGKRDAATSERWETGAIVSVVRARGVCDVCRYLRGRCVHIHLMNSDLITEPEKPSLEPTVVAAHRKETAGA